jgi:acetyl esterase/lipase/precorrin-6B methylase 2
MFKRNLVRLGRFGFLLLAGAFLLPGISAPGQEKSVRPGINEKFQKPDLKEFLGKFEVESREIFAHRKEIVAACKLKPGMSVADVGAGTGLFTRLMAKELGPKGHVYAVDIAPAFLDHIKKTCAEAGLKNVTTVQCTQTSVELPPQSVDLVFICDTYHHFEFPFRTMATIHKALKPGGQLVLIDFHRIEGKSSEWVLGHVRAGQDVFLREVVSCGFKVVEEQKFLKENYFVRLEKVDEAKTTAGAGEFVYKKTKQGELTIHVHYPPGWKKDDKRAGIIFFFGGGWNQGNIKQFEPQAKYLAERGMVAALADYRVKSRHDVTPRECVEDARSAVRWLRRNAGMLGIDPDRIVASGGSAGGHIAACTAIAAGTDAEDEDLSVSCKPNGLLLFNPVLQFDGQPELLKRIGNDSKLGKLISPTLHLHKDSPPALLFYGTDDRLIAHGEAYLRRAKELGHRAEMFTAKDVGHGFFNRSPWTERTLLRADEFLASLGYLSGKPTFQAP